MERSSRTKKATLYTFLQEHKAEKGSAFTHTSIYHPIGSFYIPPEHVDRFFDLYKEAVLAGEEMFLTEKHREIGPVVIDLDFRFDRNENAATAVESDEAVEAVPVRRYTRGDVDNIITIYGKALGNMLGDGIDSFDIYVLEKPVPSFTADKNIEKDGIHLIIPYIATNQMTQLRLREIVLPPLTEALNTLDLKNSIADVVDEAVISRNNWQMLGSKKPHCEMYRVTRIVRFDCATKTIETVTDNINEDKETQVEFVEHLSIRNKYVETQLKTEAIEDVVAFEAKMQESKIKSHFKNTILSKTRNCKNNANDEDLKQAGILVDFLITSRAESYYDWIRVGWCLRNIDHRLCDKWAQFSRKSPKFREGECERMWNYMRQDGACLGMGTLHLWAKTDSPEEYAKYMATELRTLIRESSNGSEYDIARVVHRKYDHLYAYDAESKMWYFFANHRWHHTSDGLALKRKFPTEVAVEYRRAASYYITLANQIEDTAQKNVLDELSTKLQGIVTKLKKAAFQACVMTECIMLFAIDKFEEKLDSNRNLVGFENGVYDLDALEFRDGRPEDFVSMSTGVNYIPYDPVNTICIKEVMAFLRQVITIERVREYVLRLLASFLHGDIREERFHVWTGSGCHKINSPIMMFDGSIKKVQDVDVGDKLMGDDSTPRNVLQLFRGRDTMYEVIPDKGDAFVVNKGHTLSLKATDPTMIHYYDEAWWIHYKEYHPTKVLVNKRSEGFATSDDAMAFAHGEFRKMRNVCQDGDILDMSVEKYVEHSEECLRLYRAQDADLIAFDLKELAEDDYYGFELDSNHRYLSGDFIVHHNSNGKSKLLELYQKAYGEYCCTLPIALLTQKRGSSSGASPELARARRKRFACLQEPGENERLNIGLMKEMTGGDTLYARGLYKDGMEFKPQFKMILTCNHLPLVPSDDGGTWRRIRVVRFESKFCENPDPNKPNDFPIDTTLSQKFNDWSEGFMSLLIEYYKKNMTDKIVEPDEVLECTREYQRRNDIIADFLDSAVVKDDSGSGFLQLGEAFNDFKSWLKDEGCTDRSMRKSDFQSYIEKVYGKASMLHKLKGWKGYKLKSSLMEVSAGDDYD